MNIIVVYNPGSGSAFSLAELKEKFIKHSITVKESVKLSDAIDKDLAPYIRSGATICAIGGDGTLSAVAACLAGSQAVFMPLAGGTLNHFTKDLKIPQDIDEAIMALKYSKVYKIDVANVNGKTFINNSSLGLYPSSLHMRKRFEDHLGKWPAAVIASMRSLVRFRTYKVTINHKTFQTPFIFVGNNHYLFDSSGVTRARLDEGELSVVVAKAASRSALFKIVLWALAGKTHTLDELETYKTTSLTVHAKNSVLSVARDGEVERMRTPLCYAISPKNLRIRY